MAAKPTIYKFKIALSDVNRQYYETLNLTTALHPSETLERMMVRMLAFCIDASEQLQFSKGLYQPEDADIWSKTLDNQISVWIDVGEPSADRIKKACRLADFVKIYAFNSKAAQWWLQSRDKLSFSNLNVFQIDRESLKPLVDMIQRTMDLSVTITGNSAFIGDQSGGAEVSWEVLKD